MKKVSLLILVYLFAFTTHAQEVSNGSGYDGNKKFKKDYRYFMVGGGINFTQYFGDLNPFSFSNLFQKSSSDVGISANLNYRVSSHFEFSAELSWLRLTADEFYSSDSKNSGEIKNYTRNLSFRNDMLDWSILVKYYLVKNQFSFEGRPFFSPYLFLGIGMAYQSPKGRIPEFKLNNERNEDFGKWEPLRPLGTEGQFSDHYDIDPYSYFQPTIPLGLGLSFKINNTLNINFEASYRYLFTDYIDDVSGNYVDLGALNSDLARSFSDRSFEINSSNGRYPRDFDAIYNYTQPTIYTSKYNGQTFEVLDGFGNERDPRGDEKSKDFYILSSIKLTYVLVGKRSKTDFLNK